MISRYLLGLRTSYTTIRSANQSRWELKIRITNPQWDNWRGPMGGLKGGCTENKMGFFKHYNHNCLFCSLWPKDYQSCVLLCLLVCVQDRVKVELLVSITKMDRENEEEKKTCGWAEAGLLSSSGDRFFSYHFAVFQSGVRWVIWED